MQSEEQKEKKWRQINRHSEKWDPTKYTKPQSCEYQKQRKEKNKSIEEIIVENVPNFLENIDLYIKVHQSKH